MTMSKPIWLLDFDGVINAISPHPPAWTWPREDWIRTIGNSNLGESFPILVAKPVISLINEVHDSDQIEIRWHSTWQDSIYDLAAELGLPKLPVTPAPEFNDWFYQRGRGGWWKLPAAQRLLADGHRLLWTDDDLSDLTHEQREQLRVSGAYLVTPDYATGLNERDIRNIRAYIRDLGV